MPDGSNLSGSDIRKLFQQSDTGGDASSAPPQPPGSGADIRARFRAADEAAPATQPPAAQTPPPVAYGDTLVAPDDLARINAPPVNPPITSLQDLRSRIQQYDLGAQEALKPSPEDNWLTTTGKWAGSLGAHLAGNIAQIPVNALIAAQQGASGNVLIDPNTNKISASPEALQTSSLIEPGLRFGASPGIGGALIDRTKAPDLPPDLVPPEIAARTAPGGPQAPSTPLPARYTEGAAPPAAAPPEAPGATAGPQAAGAQITPTYDAMYTPKEEQAYRSTQEGTKLLEPQIKGERDNNQYIPGVTPNQAELEQTAEAARDMKALGIQTPEASQLAQETAQRNNIERAEYARNTSKSPVDIDIEEQAREADIARDRTRVFADNNVQGDVSMQPLIDQMNAEKNLRINRQNSALQSTYNGLIKRLQDDDGNALTMHPEEAWSLRQDIDRMTDKLSTTDTDRAAINARRVAHNLSGVADTLDGLINDAAPGYNDMLATYRAHSDKIREMQVLQPMLSKITTGPNGALSFSGMQRFMKGVVDSRATGPQDLNPYKSISPETMQRLWNLRDDLRRSAGALELSRAAGSDTTQNIMDVLRTWGKVAGQGAANYGAAHFFGPAGPVALRMFQEATAPYLAARATQRNIAAMQNFLNPNVPLRTPPGQENPLTGAPPPP